MHTLGNTDINCRLWLLPVNANSYNSFNSHRTHRYHYPLLHWKDRSRHLSTPKSSTLRSTGHVIRSTRGTRRIHYTREIQEDRVFRTEGSWPDPISTKISSECAEMCRGESVVELIFVLLLVYLSFHLYILV